MGNDNLDLTYEQMRSLVLESIREHGLSQIGEMKTKVASTARRLGLYKDAQLSANQYGSRPAYMGGGRHQDFLTDREFGTVRDIVWDLVIEGIVRPGLADGLNSEFPFLHLTDRGQAAIKDGPPSPYDPDGYLSRLNAAIPKLDTVIVSYLNESLHTFRIGCLLSSTISLGCASEKAMLLLIDAYGTSLQSPGEKTRFEKATADKMIKTQFSELQKSFDGDLRGRLKAAGERDLADRLNLELSALFEFIRRQRNTAGHPTGITMTREQVYSNLTVFPEYARTIYALIGWIQANPKP